MIDRFNIFISTIPIFLCALFISGQSPAASVNYCHDDEINRDWENLAHHNNEPEIKELYRLRKDLCDKIDQGEIELDDAIDIFEKQRQLKIKTLKQRKLQLESSSSSAG